MRLACLALALLPGCGYSVRVPDAGSEDASVSEDARPSSDAQLRFVTPEGESVEALLYSEPYHLEISDLRRGERVTVYSELAGYRGFATFLGNERGVVDTSRDVPLGGTYSQPHPDALIWSMRREEDLPVSNLDVHYRVEGIGGQTLAAATMHRRPLDVGLRRVELDDGLVGVLFRPRSATPRPVVIVLGGSEGGLETSTFRASWIAQAGYAALGLAYFGVEGLPDMLTDVPIEYFERALRWIEARRDVDGSRLAIYGASRGGELALMLAARFAEIDAVIAEAPSGVRWGSASELGRAAWTLDGVALPHLSLGDFGAAQREILDNGSEAYRYAPVFEAAIAGSDPETLEAATIQVENAESPILMLGGADDGLWPTCALATIAMERLAVSGHVSEYGDELICFEEAGHYLGMPGWPTTESYAHPASEGRAGVVMGGTPRGTALAQRAVFNEVRAFLALHLN